MRTRANHNPSQFSLLFFYVFLFDLYLCWFIVFLKDGKGVCVFLKE